jgi:predicted secreted protein
MRMRGVAFAALLPLLEAGLGNGPGNAMSRPGEERDVQVLTERDDGHEVPAAVGRELALKLPCQPGTGFSWRVLQRDGKVLELVGEPKLEDADAGLLGRVERQVFRLRPLAPGTTSLELGYARLWEAERKPEKTFHVTLKIR